MSFSRESSNLDATLRGIYSVPQGFGARIRGDLLVRRSWRRAGRNLPVTIQFRGKIYSGATKLDAVQAAHAANPDVGLEHISNAVTPETTAAGVDAHYAARRAQAAPGGVGAAATPPSALLPPAAPEPKISVIQPVRNFAHAIRAIFDAPGMGSAAKIGAGLSREFRGLSRRASEQARTTLEPFMRQVRRLSIDDRLKLIDYIETRTEGGAAWFMKDPTLQPVADALRDVFWRVRNTLEDMPSEARMGFIEDYFPHQWVDPKKAGEFVRQWVARMGEGGFTKKRSIPTLVDGIRAGLVPRTVDPIEAALLYIENAYQFIAHNRTFNEAKDAGYIKLATPGDQPDGWVRLNGRLADRGFVKAWAPEDFARVYNNALSTLAGPAGDVINGLRRAFNVITGIELAWPGFHMSAMAMESIANKIASALSDATRWRLDQTAIKLATSPAAPVTMLRRGAEAQRIYRSLTDGSAEMREIVDLLTSRRFQVRRQGPGGGRVSLLWSGQLFQGDPPRNPADGVERRLEARGPPADRRHGRRRSEEYRQGDGDHDGAAVRIRHSETEEWCGGRAHGELAARPSGRDGRGETGARSRDRQRDRRPVRGDEP